MKTVSEWLKKHNACPPGYRWAVENCTTMQDVWNTAKPEWLTWVATRQGVLDDITLRRFACFCARQVWHLLEDERSKTVVEVAERLCDGTATTDELSVARDAARGAAWDVARGAAWDAAWGAAWDEQAKWLLNNCKPNFKEEA